MDFDVIIVGSGPAGVSAAFPLLDAGLRVLMLDGGRKALNFGPSGDFLGARIRDSNQWTWMLGRDFHALRQVDAVSPKLRVPNHAPIFDGFVRANRIESNNVVAIGSLAAGGLSNAWGCGVACFTDEELSQFPFSPSELKRSYDRVGHRIGINKCEHDDLSQFYGFDSFDNSSIQLDDLHIGLYARYLNKRKSLVNAGFKMGRSRLAVLSSASDERQACNSCGSCLWGCERRSLYSAAEDLEKLIKYKNFTYQSGFLVEEVAHQESSVVLYGSSLNNKFILKARKVMLAAGTLATTRLALHSLDYRKPITMQSCPTAAFMLWLPKHLGRSHKSAFGLSQLTFTLNLRDSTTGFGALFGATGIPLAEFARYMPLGKRYAVDILSHMLSSCVIGNIFLPGNFTKYSLQLNATNALSIKGEFRDEVRIIMAEAHHKLMSHFGRLGAIMLPFSFKIGKPGGDIHYAASLPMGYKTDLGNTNSYGALIGAKNIYIVDGACLSSLPAKSHTLTIMANADRIGCHVAKSWVK